VTSNCDDGERANPLCTTGDMGSESGDSKKREVTAFRRGGGDSGTQQPSREGADCSLKMRKAMSYNGGPTRFDRLESE